MGEGVNEGSEYIFDDVFRIRNDQSVNDPIGHEVDLWVTTEGLDSVQFYAEGDTEDRIEEELDGDEVEGSVTIHVEESPAGVRD